MATKKRYHIRVQLKKDPVELGKQLVSHAKYFPAFCEKCLKITTRDGRLIPFELNQIQMWFFLKYILKPWLAGAPVRVILLKCRQTGMSTLMSAFSFWCTVRSRHKSTLLIARDDVQSKTIFKMTKRFIDNLPSGDDNILPHFPTTKMASDGVIFNKPETHKFSRRLKSMRRKVYLDSEITIDSGERKVNVGRGGTKQVIHCSEVAFWPYLQASLSTLMATKGEFPETAIILETTANGYNEFFALWNDDDCDGIIISEYWTRCFIPWYWVAEYELEDDKIKRVFVDEYEEKLFARIITDDVIEKISRKRAWAKLLWRRQQIAARSGDVAEFSQEFPATPSEAFKATGSPVFSQSAMDDLQFHVKEPEWIGEVSLRKKDKKPELHKTSDGDLKIWEVPKKHDQYIIAWDIAEGKARKHIAERKSRYDYTVGQVLKITPYPPLEQVAVWHGSIDPDMLGEIMVALAKMYNRAYLVWEVNNAGRGLNYHVCSRLRYGNVHRREDYDEGGPKQHKAVGWKTTGTTKPNMVMTLRQYTRERTIIVHDEKTLNEMRAYQDFGNLKYGVIVGHDDRVDSLAIAGTVVAPHVNLFQRRKERSMEKEQERKASNSSYGKRRKFEDWNPMLGNEF